MQKETQIAFGIIKDWASERNRKSRPEEAAQGLAIVAALFNEECDYKETKDLKSFKVYKEFVKEFADIFANAATQLDDPTEKEEEIKNLAEVMCDYCKKLTEETQPCDRSACWKGQLDLARVIYNAGYRKVAVADPSEALSQLSQSIERATESTARLAAAFKRCRENDK